MSKGTGGGKRRAGRRKLPRIFNDADPAHVALSDEETRLLVLEITMREGTEPFVRRMVRLIDALKAGRMGEVARLARRSKDPSYAELMSAVTRAVGEGRVMPAYHTAFYAAHCAYQNSLEYLCTLMCYLDRFRK